MKKGWRNNYIDKLSWFEVLGKDLKFYIKDLIKRFKNNGRLPVIVTYPDFPSKRTTIFKIADQLNFRITNKLVADARVFLFFEDQTHSVLPTTFASLSNRILNDKVLDISKKKVDHVHLEVFGYNTIIDPTTFKGKAVRKSDKNALHDGEVIDCPIESSDPNSVYQIVIDNSFDAHHVVDFRVPVIAGEIPLCYKKFKEYKVRFTNDVSSSTLHSPKEIFSDTELIMISDFANKFELDFGELDVLRHSDGKIYIIDVNKTPYGPPFGLALEDKEKAVSMLTASFKKNFL